MEVMEMEEAVTASLVDLEAVETTASLVDSAVVPVDGEVLEPVDGEVVEPVDGEVLEPVDGEVVEPVDGEVNSLADMVSKRTLSSQPAAGLCDVLLFTCFKCV
ncbi:hypothetical protein BsWGS_16371 [Bradybaena similaris]